MYTSGSTGGPKGVTLTHQNLAFVTGSIVDYLEMTSADRVLCVMQLSFGYGLSQLLACVRVGAALALEAGIAFPGGSFRPSSATGSRACPGSRRSSRSSPR